MRRAIGRRIGREDLTDVAPNTGRADQIAYVRPIADIFRRLGGSIDLRPVQRVQKADIGVLFLAEPTFAKSRLA